MAAYTTSTMYLFLNKFGIVWHHPVKRGGPQPQLQLRELLWQQSFHISQRERLLYRIRTKIKILVRLG